jgi:hypothetical protein
MKTNQHSVAPPVETLPAPQGIGSAVSFDWAIGVQLTSQGIAALVLNPGAKTALLLAGYLAGAALPVAQGESLRRGKRWALGIQLVAMGIMPVGGLVLLPQAIAAIRAGQPFGALSAGILLFVAPPIFWRLSRPGTRAWFRRVDSVTARRRHGGRWVPAIAAIAFAGGLIVAWSQGVPVK